MNADAPLLALKSTYPSAKDKTLAKSIFVEPGFRGFEFNGNPFALVDDMLEVFSFHTNFSTFR